MRRRNEPSPDIIAKVNVTPIIDVALVLVIILLVTAPLMSVSNLPVDLPQAHTREAEDERNISVTRTVDGALAVDDARIAPGQLGPALRRRLQEPGNQNVLVVIRADSSLPYSELDGLLAQARSAGAKRLAVATRQQTKETR